MTDAGIRGCVELRSKTISPVNESTTIIDGSAKNLELDRLWKTLEIEVGAIFSNACAGAAETTSEGLVASPVGADVYSMICYQA